MSDIAVLAASAQVTVGRYHESRASRGALLQTGHVQHHQQAGNCAPGYIVAGNISLELLLMLRKLCYAVCRAGRGLLDVLFPPLVLVLSSGKP